jgi:hypothetical protein
VPPASREELERLSIKVLWGLCKQRGITSLSKGPVPQQVNALLSHPDGPLPPSALPIKASKGSKTSKTSKGGQPQPGPAGGAGRHL